MPKVYDSLRSNMTAWNGHVHSFLCVQSVIHNQSWCRITTWYHNDSLIMAAPILTCTKEVQHSVINFVISKVGKSIFISIFVRTCMKHSGDFIKKWYYYVYDLRKYSLKNSFKVFMWSTIECSKMKFTSCLFVFIWIAECFRIKESW